ncbi:MAG: hypothetical protein J6T72_03080 [Alphaproteobacteria bacterium]|nr:hypothetical protein [Alphaproteobacteria bacterium]
MQDLAEILSHYGIKGEVTGINVGPLVKQIEFLPEAGTKIKNITTSLADIAREMGVSSLRVEPIAGTQKLGFEIAADTMQTVDFSGVVSSDEFKNQKGALPLYLGVDIAGKPVFADLAKMPHLLIGGTTGSGKSVALNCFILSLISIKKPSELKFVLIDPKRIEFSVYNNQSYLLGPVVTDNKQAASVLKYLVDEMERRYGLFEETMVRNIGEYNDKGEFLPYIVCVIDEFADLISADKNVDDHVQRLAQKARAAGIHLILATQRPSVDVVTGVLKANFPTRMAFKVASQFDSRTILDMPGAEDLLGRGDALFLPQNGEIKRVHGAYVPDDEIAKIIEPYHKKVSDWEKILPKELQETNLPQATQKGSSKVQKPKEGFCRRCLNWWSQLRVREQKTIIRWLKYLFSAAVTIMATKQNRRR